VTLKNKKSPSPNHYSSDVGLALNLNKILILSQAAILFRDSPVWPTNKKLIFHERLRARWQ